MPEVKMKRLSYIDSLKGFAILLVLLGHNSFNDYVTYVIYFFHMPLFFFISGYLAKTPEVSIKQTFKRKWGTLIYPYFVFGIIILLYNTVLDKLRGMFSVNKFFRRIAAILYGNFIFENNSDYIGTLWFLVCLFCTVLISEMIIKLNSQKKEIFFCICLLILALGTSWLKNKYSIRLPWCLDISFVAVQFYMAGHGYRKYEAKAGKFSLILIALGMICGICNTLYMKRIGYQMLRVDMLNLNYGLLPLLVLSAIFISAGLMGAFKVLNSKFSCKQLQLLGRLSLLIMIDHIYINQVIMLGLIHLGINVWIISFPICTIISVLLALFVHKYLPFLENINQLPLRRR